eukprot:PhF_6_TR29248/c0_g1_i1/m.42809
MDIEDAGNIFPKFSEVRRIHVELSTDCNAACPMCARNIHGGKRNPLFKVTSMSLTEFRRIFPPHVLQQLKKIMFCGNYGDPVMAPECVEIITYIRSANPGLTIGVHTNGGARDDTFWSTLGTLLRHPSYVRFAIDGLADTNHLYRQHVKWEALVSHVKSFVANGGYATMDCLIFRHNEHQVEDIHAFAKSIGIQNVSLKKTARFF